MKQTEIEQGVTEVLSAMLGREVAPALTRASEPGWDSLKHMQIVFAIEERFGVQFTEEEIPTLDSFITFVQHLQKHHAA